MVRHGGVSSLELPFALTALTRLMLVCPANVSLTSCVFVRLSYVTTYVRICKCDVYTYT